MSPGMSGYAFAFLRSTLGRRFLVVLLCSLTICSLTFLALFVHLYRTRLVHEHTRASTQVNEVLQAALENAMLKRDLPGLAAIVDAVGKQSDIAEVMILNPGGEIRFSSAPAMIGMNFADVTREAGAAPAALQVESAAFTVGAQGAEVLRTINPVHNRVPCSTCHGEISGHPINGILVVDYHADQIRSNAFLSALAMTGSGGLVALAALLSLSIVFYRSVLRPLQGLSVATGRFADGDLSARFESAGRDELSVLGGRFNAMAERLGRTIHSLRGSEGFLQSVIDAVPDGMRVVADDFTVLKVNQAYAAQHGIPAAQAIGMKCHLSSHGLREPCSPTMITCPVVALRDQPGQSLKCLHRHLRADGSELFVEVTAAAVELEIDGVKRNCVIESFRDLADQARMSQEQRLSELGHLATGVAHEVHNPLSSIQLALRAIRAETAGTRLPERIEGYLGIVDREIDRCIDMTSRLLRLSEPSNSAETLVDLKETLGEVVSLLRYQADAAGVSVTVDIADGLRVIGVESDIGMVAVNLIQNALHAMPRGGALSITGRREGRGIRLDFADSGVGIEEADLAKVFWPFWSKRADDSHGTGLGLSICKVTIEHMGGMIRVASQPGKGAIFTIEFPSADAAPISP